MPKCAFLQLTFTLLRVYLLVDSPVGFEAGLSNGMCREAVNAHFLYVKHRHSTLHSQAEAQCYVVHACMQYEQTLLHVITNTCRMDVN